MQSQVTLVKILVPSMELSIYVTEEFIGSKPLEARFRLSVFDCERIIARIYHASDFKSNEVLVLYGHKKSNR